ncbi:TonB-dependent receptor [Tamlana sp. 2201CG12-4]|uniref:SusC/RagA family TonB-linked outer membrane protein n=1 Tax=Tamlana sp. 2201CG12-4 TaxID=3112582 RepID=UPI002DB90D6A|nr:TonB-dependent receptor [Tamlana sp. 2201CG12-4]MEC3905811.1 TonB-dependent receptor [Tamlana sp. 2201CG12-4]
MRSFIFLCCTITFAFSPGNGFSQDAEVTIKKDQTLSVKQIFKLINKQTDYKFIYRHDLIKDAPNLYLKKGVIKASDLLNESLASINFTYAFTENNTIIVKKRPEGASNGDSQKESELELQNTITGVVLDETGVPLPGANIIEKGTTNGAQTDFDGNFSLDLLSADATLVVSYVGYKATEVVVGNQTTLRIALELDSTLDEIVVVGYGRQRKSDLTGAVSSIKSEEIAKTPLFNVADAISGKAAGVQVTTNNGSPGAAPTIRIRGTGTLNDSSPIFVVDGLILDDITFLNNNDIASIEVLKDASATAIYGSRGANGVIMVTTKRGKKGKARIDLNVTTGVSHVENVIDMVNATEYATLQNLAALNAGEADVPYPDPESYGEGVDWWDQLYSTALSQDYSLSASGATDNVTYHISAGLQDQKGLIEKTDFQRLTLRANNEYKLSKLFKVGHNVSYIKTKKLNGPDATQAAYRIPAVFEPYNADGTFNGDPDFSNPLVGTFYNNAETENERFIGNFFGEVTVSDFTFRSTYGFEKSDQFALAYAPEFYVSDIQFRDQSMLTKTYRRFRSYIWDNILTYTKEIGDHHVDLLAGITKQDTYWERLRGQATNIPDNKDLWYLDATFDPLSRVSENIGESWSYLSYLFRANYSFKNRYLFTGTYRIDGSSKFSKDNRYAHFPSLAAGWRVTEESFMDNVHSISNLKLRASWGKIGNDKTRSPYPSKQFLSTTETIGGNESGIVAIQGPDETPHQGATAIILADPNIKWETTTQTDIGLELGLFNNKLKAEIDYYNRKTDDILIDIPIASYFGIRVDPTVNAASVKNHGFEYVLSWSDGSEDFNYSVSANLSTINNEVLRLSDRRSVLNGSFQSQTLTRTQTGGPIGAFWGYKTAGIFQNQDQIDNSPTLGGEAPGDLIYVDTNGDDVITEEDMTVIGSPIADFTFGFNVAFDYKNFDFSMDVNGVYGNEILNLKAKKRWSSTYDYEQRFVHSWNGEGSTNVHPRVNNADTHNELQNDYWLEDGSYLRIRNVQLGYTLPRKLLEKINIANVRFFTGVTNLVTFTKYSGFTPDVTLTPSQTGDTSDVLLSGIDSGVYPLSTTYNFGLNVSF